MPGSREIIKSALESMLYVWGRPLPAGDAARVFGLKEEEAVSLFLELQKEYEARDSGIRIRRIRNSFQYITAPENAEFVRRLCTPVKEKRLTQASLEVLAIIAYLQPVTKGRIDQIRGIKCDRVVEGLMEKGLVESRGRSSGVGRPILYGTTDSFLEYLGLESLDELPEISEEGILRTEPDTDEPSAEAEGTEKKGLENMNMGEQGNIIMVGMPSCGKSTIGAALAEAEGKKFLDADDVIEEQEGRTLQEIIDADGNDYFAEAEKRALLSIHTADTVIATGGSAIFAEDAIEQLRRTGKVVYIRIQEETVEKRLDNLDSRGVTMEEGQTLADLYALRTPYYEKHADITVDGDGRAVEDVVAELCKLV